MSIYEQEKKKRPHAALYFTVYNIIIVLLHSPI